MFALLTKNNFLIGVAEEQTNNEAIKQISIKISEADFLTNALNSGLVIEYISPDFVIKKTNIKNWDETRKIRENLLAEADDRWRMIYDKSVISGEQIDKDSELKIVIYRQKLRDITKDFDSPENICWPQKPW